MQIVTRANKQWRAEITQIVWTDDQTCICETASQDSNKQGAAPAKPAKPAKQAASGKTGAKARQPAPATDDHVPAPPRTEAIPTDDLDAMADAAAEQEGDYDDVMSAMAEFERDERG